MTERQPRITEAPKHIGEVSFQPDRRVDLTKCYDCGTYLGQPEEGSLLFVRWCDSCESKREADANAAIKTSAKSPWDAKWDEGDSPICPKIYRDTSPDYIGFNRSAWAVASKWSFGPRGLTLFGDSRKCKSRIMFLLLRREYLENRRSVRVIFGPKLRDMAKQAAREGREHEMAQALARPDLLALDDPFLSGAADERVTTFLGSVIDARVCDKKPIILTTQLGRMDLVESAGRFGNITEADIHRLAAVFERLYEVSTTVEC